MRFSLSQMRKAVSFLLKKLKIDTDEIIFHFVSEKKICSLHDKFFNDPTPTDCISFPIDSQNTQVSYHVLGEAFICPKTALNYAKRHRIGPLEELYRYVIHCILHFIGYEDMEARERARMKRKERTLLSQLALLLAVKKLP